MAPNPAPLKPEAVADPAAYANPRALDVLFEQLRAQDPVHWTAPEGFRPFWLVTRYGDIMEIEGRADVFLSGPRPVLLPAEQEERNMADYGSTGGLRTLIHMDDPDHSAYRGLTHSWFMGQNLQRLQGRVRTIAKEIVAEMREKEGAFDFAREIAFRYPLRIIMLILGVPKDDEALMTRFAASLFGGSFGPLQSGAPGDVMPEFADYFKRIARERRAESRDDLSSVIANGQIGGKPMSDEDAVPHFLTAATAGHDTTSAVAAGGMLALIQHPEEFARLKGDLSLVPSAIDEFVRWTTPVKHFMRTAAEDYTLGDVVIRKGQSIMLHYQSANRDEEAYEEPFALKLDRKPNRHLAFGYGPHRCLGRYLALMELSALYEELMPHLGEIELAGDPEFMPSYFVSGLKSLPVSCRMG